MKNQYYGDKRDFIKYSLIVDVLKKPSELSTFAFIPMLTKPDKTKEGNVRAYECGERDKKVYEFLRATQDNKDIKNWRDFFNKANFPNLKYIHKLDDVLFSHQERYRYFQKATNLDIKDNALVFLDPDIGIQPENAQTWQRIRNHPEKAEKYVLQCDVKLISECVKNSVLMIYQHLQRNRKKHKTQAEEKLRALSVFFGVNASSVRCDDVQYIFASHNDSLQQKINNTLKIHASDNGMTFEIV